MRRLNAPPPPENVTVDCSTGDVVCTPLTPEEIAARQAAADALAQQQASAAAARQKDISAVLASPDPALLALARLMGVIQ